MQEVTSTCPLPPRKIKVALHDRANHVFDLLHIPGDIRLDFFLRLNRHNKQLCERWTRLWEDFYDCYHHCNFLRDWNEVVSKREDLLVAASTDPTIVLPDSVYSFMVAKGAFRPYNSLKDRPMQWLEVSTG